MTSVELDGTPTCHLLERGSEGAAVASRNEQKRPVVAGEPERAADRRVDQSVGRRRSVEGRAQRFEQQRADTHRTARGVRARELAVAAEPAAGQVELRQLGLDRGARPPELRGLGDSDKRGRSQRRERRRRCHEPPETTTAGAGVGAGAAGGGAGVAAGGDVAAVVAPAGAVEEPCFTARSRRGRAVRLRQTQQGQRPPRNGSAPAPGR